MYGFTLNRIPCVKLFGFMKQEAVWTHGEVVTEDEILVFPLSGSATFLLEGTREVTVDTRHVLYLPAGIRRKARANPSFEYLFIHFAPFENFQKNVTFTAPAARNTLSGSPAIFVPDMNSSREMVLDTLTDISGHYDSLNRLLEDCLQLMPDLTPCRKMLLDARCLQFLCTLCRITESVLSESAEWPPLLCRITDFIRRNYAMPLTLQEVSARFGVSTAYIARLFRRHVRKTFTAYVTQVKMDYAADMLTGGCLNIGEIAERLGYANLYYFSSVFRKYSGCSPTEYRRRTGA